MGEFSLDQAYITSYNIKEPRTCTCLQVPDHYPIVNVQLPSTMGTQTRPLVGSLVMVASMDNYKHYILAILREPDGTFNQNTDQVLSSDTQYRGNTLQPGEIFLQAAGTPNQGTGLNASLYIGNNGCIELESSSGTEAIIIGGEGFDDDDHENIIRAPNVTIESPLTAPVGIQSSISFDDLNTISIANNVVTAATSIGVPTCELTIDAVGNIVLRNTNAGISNASLSLSFSGDVQLSNLTSQLNLDVISGVTLNSFAINLNKGTQPAARMNDSTFSSVIQDPTFWQFIQNLFIVFNAHVHTSAAPGNPTSSPLVPLTTYPTQMSGIISSGSATVKVG